MCVEGTPGETWKEELGGGPPMSDYGWARVDEPHRHQKDTQTVLGTLVPSRRKGRRTTLGGMGVSHKSMERAQNKQQAARGGADRERNLGT